MNTVIFFIEFVSVYRCDFGEGSRIYKIQIKWIKEGGAIITVSQ